MQQNHKKLNVYQTARAQNPEWMNEHLPLASTRLAQLGAPIIHYMDEMSETIAGKLIWEQRKAGKFVVGSQGVEYALIRHWQTIGVIDPPPVIKGIGKADRIAVIPLVMPLNDWAYLHCQPSPQQYLVQLYSKRMPMER